MTELQIYNSLSLANEYAYLKRQIPSLHDGPTYPALHPVRQIPLSGEHWVGSIQWPHISSQKYPYRPMGHSVEKNIYTEIEI